MIFICTLGAIFYFGFGILMTIVIMDDLADLISHIPWIHNTETILLLLLWPVACVIILIIGCFYLMGEVFDALFI